MNEPEFIILQCEAFAKLNTNAPESLSMVMKTGYK